MAKKPDSQKGKDPARPTRSKAAREPLAPIAPALEKLLNPGIAKGTAGIGSGTGLSAPADMPKRTGKLPGEGVREKEPETGLRPPADNSWDRREDFSAAHRARKSVNSPLLGPELSGRVPGTPLPNPPPQGGREPTEYAAPESARSGLSEAPQSPYSSDAELIEASPELARAL